MSNLSLLIGVGVVAVLVLCFLHGRVEAKMPRAKFVFLTLIGLGSLPIGYALLWVLAGDRPDFDLWPSVTFGLTLWASALAYSALVTLLLKAAPSK